MTVTNVGYLFAKGLRAVMENAFEAESDKLEAILPSESSSLAFEEWLAKVGTGMADEKPIGQEFPEQEIIIKDPKRVWHVTYGLQVRTPFEWVDDDQYNKITPKAQDAGSGLRIRMTHERAGLFNLAFANTLYTGYDGLSLINSAHLLDKPAYTYATTNITALSQLEKTAYTFSNQLATAQDFDYTALIDAITLLRRTPGWEGEPLDIDPAWILGGVPNWAAMDEILGSPDRPDTANRAKSVLSSKGIRSIQSARLLDDDAWFLGASKNDLHFFLRMGIKTKVNVDPTTWDYLTQGAVRFCLGFYDPRGIVGTPGV